MVKLLWALGGSLRIPFSWEEDITIDQEEAKFIDIDVLRMFQSAGFLVSISELRRWRKHSGLGRQNSLCS